MGKFKVGDRVKCVDSTACDFLTSGREYVLAEVNDSYVYAAWDGSERGGMLHRRFELVPAEAEFKVGDRVRADGGYEFDPSAGVILEAASGGWRVKVEGAVESGASKDIWYYYDRELTIIPAATPAFTIEDGKFYKTRDGRKVGPVVEAQGRDDPWPWKALVGLTTYYYRNTGHSCPGYAHAHNAKDDLIAEWVEPATQASNDNGLKFKVGDLVKATVDWCDIRIGDILPIIRVELKGVWVKDNEGDDSYLTFDEFVPVTPTPAIVALIENGTPKPSTTPKVHATQEAATTEATRLASLYRGQQFGIFVLADTRETDKPVYEHEWQNLAARGEKINAIKALKSLTGMGLKPSKDAVEYFLAAA